LKTQARPKESKHTIKLSKKKPSTIYESLKKLMCRQLRLCRFRRPMKLDGGEQQRGSRSIITNASVTVVGGGVGLERR